MSIFTSFLPGADTWSKMGGGGQALCFAKMMSHFPNVLEQKTELNSQSTVGGQLPPGVHH